MPHLQRNKDKNYIPLLLRNYASRKIIERKTISVEGKKPHQFRSLYPEKLSFKIEEEIKTFSDKQKFRESVANRLVCKKC